MKILKESKLIEIKKAPKQNKFATGQARKIIFVGDTHSAYTRKGIITITNLTKPIKTAKDLEIVKR